MDTKNKMDFSDYEESPLNDSTNPESVFNEDGYQPSYQSRSGSDSGSGSGSGSGSSMSAMVRACVGKKYGDYCEWTADNGKRYSGKCIYDKWGWSPGSLFCANADYKDDNLEE